MKSTFRIVGTLALPKNGLVLNEINSDKSSWEGLSLTGSIKSGNNNFRIKFFGGEFKDEKDPKKYADKVVKLWENGQEVGEVVIPFDKRFDNELLNKVPNSNKATVILGGVRNDYVFQDEFVKVVKKKYEELMGTKVVITGEVSYTFGSDKGVVYSDFTVNNIYECKPNDQGVIEEDSAKANMQFYYQFGTIDNGIFTDKGELDFKLLSEAGMQLEMDVFVESRNSDKNTSKLYKSLYYPVKIKFNGSNLDLTNELHRRIGTFMLDNFRIKKDDSKVYTTAWEVRLKSGREEVEIDEKEVMKMLTPQEKLYLELYPDKAKEFMAKKAGVSMYGAFSNEIQLLKPHTQCPARTECKEVSGDMLSLYKAIKTEPSTSVKTSKSKPATKEKEENKEETGDIYEGLF